MDIRILVGICVIIAFFLLYLLSDCSSCIENFSNCKCGNLKLVCTVNEHLQRKCKWVHK